MSTSEMKTHVDITTKLFEVLNHVFINITTVFSLSVSQSGFDKRYKTYARFSS